MSDESRTPASRALRSLKQMLKQRLSSCTCDVPDFGFWGEFSGFGFLQNQKPTSPQHPERVQIPPSPPYLEVADFPAFESVVPIVHSWCPARMQQTVQYPLADKTYAELLDRLAKNHFAQVTRELRAAALSYYRDLNAPFSTKKDKKTWAQVVRNLDELKNSTEKKSSTPAD